jgi:MoaA/NifB/PqqE/SkfB family radical SAM enzyme
LNSSKAKRVVLRILPEYLKALTLSSAPSTYPLFRYAPHSATLHITDNCFFKCVMCDQWKARKTGELSSSEWIDVIAQLKGMNIRHISFAGGEVFMRKDLFEILHFIKSQGMTSSLITNGFILDRTRIEAAIEAGLSTFGISLDAVGEEFDRIRGVAGASQKVLSACELLAEYKRKHPIEVHLYFTLMKQTLATYREVFAVARRLGFLVVVSLVDSTPYFFKEMGSRNSDFWIESDDPALAEFQKFMVSERAKDRGAIHNLFSEIAYFKKYFADPIQKDIPCLISQNRLGIDSKGQVYGGCWSMGTFGNVKNAPLATIVGSSRYLSAHRDMFEKKCPGCSCGYAGNLRHNLGYRVKNAAYAFVPPLRPKIWE